MPAGCAGKESLLIIGCSSNACSMLSSSSLLRPPAGRAAPRHPAAQPAPADPGGASHGAAADALPLPQPAGPRLFPIVRLQLRARADTLCHHAGGVVGGLCTAAVTAVPLSWVSCCSTTLPSILRPCHPLQMPHCAVWQVLILGQSAWQSQQQCPCRCPAGAARSHGRGVAHRLLPRGHHAGLRLTGQQRHHLLDRLPPAARQPPPQPPGTLSCCDRLGR